MSVFPLSVGGVHSRATLKPQVSTIFTLAGGPGSSVNIQVQIKPHLTSSRHNIAPKRHSSSYVLLLVQFAHQQSEGWEKPCPRSHPPSRTSHILRSLPSRLVGWTGCCLSRCCGCSPSLCPGAARSSTSWPQVWVCPWFHKEKRFRELGEVVSHTYK